MGYLASGFDGGHLNTGLVWYLDLHGVCLVVNFAILKIKQACPCVLLSKYAYEYACILLFRQNMHNNFDAYFTLMNTHNENTHVHKANTSMFAIKTKI